LEETSNPHRFSVHPDSGQSAAWRHVHAKLKLSLVQKDELLTFWFGYQTKCSELDAMLNAVDGQIDTLVDMIYGLEPAEVAVVESKIGKPGRRSLSLLVRQRQLGTAVNVSPKTCDRSSFADTPRSSAMVVARTPSLRRL
jgi:hypothetical protein